MKYEYTHKITGKQEFIELVEGDIIDLPAQGAQVEIGPNDTMRGILNGEPAETGWMPIPTAYLKELAHRKIYGGAK